LQVLRPNGFDILGFFYNPNIHPYLEYQKRLETLIHYAEQENLSLQWPEDYPIEMFLRGILKEEGDRCAYCYYHRLKYAVEFAKREGLNAFTTTLLYSKYQKHELIKKIGQKLAVEYGIPFLYYDFRGGWKIGVDLSRKAEMYRQPYCGCIFSEKERFYKKNVGVRKDI
jgi:predicted adenine nucleotide alpha hydrolase (AANH) superfamily ATPase